jgi:hypothetical protein
MIILQVMRIYLFVFILSLLFLNSLLASPILFITSEEITKKIKNCSTPESEKIFEFETMHFNGSDFPKKDLTVFSKKRAQIRYYQLECIKKLNLSAMELGQLKSSYIFFRERELEGLEILSNFFILQDKSNLYPPGVLNKVKEYMKDKNDLYYILSKKTEDYLFLNQKVEIDDFISIYQSLLRLQFDLLNIVPERIRQKFIKK